MLRSFALLALGIAACSSTSASSGSASSGTSAPPPSADGAASPTTSADGAAPRTVCDPLAAPPTTLGTIIGVGKDGTGKEYVVDQGGVPAEPTDVRVFVPSGGTLYRQLVIGSGQLMGANGKDIETIEGDPGSSAPLDLTVVLDGGTATAMSIGPEGSGKLSAEGMDGGAATALTLLDPSTVAGMPAIDLPRTAAYVAEGADGSAIVVTVPMDDDVGTSAFRLFYGTTPAAMLQCPIVSFNQSDSGFPTIGFTVGAQTYVMSIASLPPPDGGLLNVPGPVTLMKGGATGSMTLRPTPTTLTGFTFECAAM